MRVFTSSYSRAALIAAVCLGAYAGAFRIRELYHDDRAIIVENPLLHRGWSALTALPASGYWEPVQGAAAPVREYRPLLMATLLAQTATTGFSGAPLRAVNVFLHLGVCLLLWLALSRRLPPPAALAGTCAFAAMAVHVEAVAMVVWRSELLVAGFLLGAWLCLEDGRLAAGCALFSAALFTKEQAVLFPIFYAMADWTLHGRSPRRVPRLYAALLACAAVYLAARGAVLGGLVHGGVAYFPSRLSAALTFPGFAARHYAWTALTGTGLCSDYSRPLIPDAASSPAAWLGLALLAALFAWAGWSLLRRRSAWALALLGPCLFLLPTSNLVFPLDAIGADRFLYIPTMGLAAGIGALAKGSRLAPRVLAAAYIAWSAWATMTRLRQWSTAYDYYSAAAACNPVSARARNGLGEALIARGDAAGAQAQWLKASELDPNLSEAYYNLARLKWQEGRKGETLALLGRALSRNPSSADALVLEALVLDDAGDRSEAVDALNEALAVNPDHPLAHYNLGRLLMKGGDKAAAAAHFARFAQLAPDDPDAARVGALVEGAKP